MRTRSTWPAILTLASLVLAAGCGLAANKVEYVVYFAPEASDVQKDAVRNACPGVGRATLEPRDKSNLKTSRTYPVRYDITKASSAERSDVYRCVSAQPGVRGVSESSNGS